MITSLRLVNFKNFADETLRIGPFTVIVGANASGKSNIRDAFRFLHGIGRGYTLAEILGGKYGGGGQREWEPIRGAAGEVVRFEQTQFSLEVELELNDTEIHYLIEVGYDPASRNKFQLLKEKLTSNAETVFESHRSDDQLELRLLITSGTFKTSILPYSERSTLSELLYAMRYIERELSPNLSDSELLLLSKLLQTSHYEILDFLDNMRFLEPSPDRMREPSFPGANILGDSGENLPVVLEGICADPKRKEILADWLSELTPMDVADFEFPRDPSGRVHLMLCEKNGRKVSAYSASDGTLRFLAMLAVLLGENPKGLYFFEEIDTGIHPARQWLLLELIEKQAAKNNIQIMTTTHAPDLLTFVNDSTFENMSVVCRLEDSHDAIIRPVAELPDAKELRQSGRGLGGLLTEGWMETALAFTENYDEAEGDGE